MCVCVRACALCACVLVSLTLSLAVTERCLHRVDVDIGCEYVSVDEHSEAADGQSGSPARRRRATWHGLAAGDVS